MPGRLSGWDDIKDIWVPWRERSVPLGEGEGSVTYVGSQSKWAGKAMEFSPAGGPVLGACF